MTYDCWLSPPTNRRPTMGTLGHLYNSVYTVDADSPEDAARAFLSAHGKASGDVEVRWSYDYLQSRKRVLVEKLGESDGS